MFSIKINNVSQKTTQNFQSIFNSLLSKFTQSKTIVDKNSIEMTVGTEKTNLSNQVLVEMVIRKNILLDDSVIQDPQKLKNYLAKIQTFISQAENFEEAHN